jgi:energy-converting hydrogenase Eha subunit C
MMMATALLHGDIWTILAGVAYMLVVYLALPIGAIVLALKYLRRVRDAERSDGSGQKTTHNVARSIPFDRFPQRTLE